MVESLLKQLNLKNEDQAYRKERKLGSGAFSTVYLASRATDNKTYAMKVLKNQFCKEQFDEIELLKSLSHPFIVRYDEAFRNTRDKVVIIFEYVDGGTLQQMIDDKSLTVPQITHYFT